LEASPSSKERHHQREAKVVRALAAMDDEPSSCSASSASIAASWQQSNPRPAAFSIVMPVVESFAPAIFANSGDSQLLPGEEEIVGMIRWR
jgi:hypothetical protein